MRTVRILLMMSLVFFMVLVLGCSDDNNPMQSSNTTEVSGTITFNGAWPTKGNIQISLWTSWPPAGPPAAFSAPLTPGVNKQTYKLTDIKKGPYAVITVGWRDPADPTGAKVIGVYSANNTLSGIDCKGDFTVAPLPVEITDSNPKATNVNLVANLDVLQLGAIFGKVNFVGAWPSKGEVQVSLWSTWPPAGPPAAASAVFTAGSNSQSYKSQWLTQKTYPVLTVGWRDTANPTGAKILGMYWSRTDSLAVDGSGRPVSGAQPLPVQIVDGKLNWTNVDIKANLGIVQ